MRHPLARQLYALARPHGGQAALSRGVSIIYIYLHVPALRRDHRQQSAGRVVEGPAASGCGGECVAGETAAAVVLDHSAPAIRDPASPNSRLRWLVAMVHDHNDSFACSRCGEGSFSLSSSQTQPEVQPRPRKDCAVPARVRPAGCGVSSCKLRAPASRCWQHRAASSRMRACGRSMGVNKEKKHGELGNRGLDGHCLSTSAPGGSFTSAAHSRRLQAGGFLLALNPPKDGSLSFFPSGVPIRC